MIEKESCMRNDGEGKERAATKRAIAYLCPYTVSMGVWWQSRELRVLCLREEEKKEPLDDPN
jgi:hypothetical protein